MGNHAVTATAIPGLMVVQLKLHEDARGWFKEGWHRAALAEAGLADTITWYQEHEDWWRPSKQATEAFYATKGQ